MMNYMYVKIGQTQALRDSTAFLIGKGKELFFLPGCSVQLKQGVIRIPWLKKYWKLAVILLFLFHEDMTLYIVDQQQLILSLVLFRDALILY